MQTEPPKGDPPKRKRRWFQFSLRTLLIVVALFAVACGYLSWQARIVRHRLKMLFDNPRIGMMSYTESVGGESRLSWLRRCLGDFDPHDIVAADDATEVELDEYRKAFPEAENILHKSDLEKLYREIYGPHCYVDFPTSTP